MSRADAVNVVMETLFGLSETPPGYSDEMLKVSREVVDNLIDAGHLAPEGAVMLTEEQVDDIYRVIKFAPIGYPAAQRLYATLLTKGADDATG
jgi:hypothetical protein